MDQLLVFTQQAIRGRYNTDFFPLFSHMNSEVYYTPMIESPIGGAIGKSELPWRY